MQGYKFIIILQVKSPQEIFLAKIKKSVVLLDALRENPFLAFFSFYRLLESLGSWLRHSNLRCHHHITPSTSVVILPFLSLTLRLPSHKDTVTVQIHSDIQDNLPSPQILNLSQVSFAMSNNLFIGSRDRHRHLQRVLLNLQQFTRASLGEMPIVD